MLSRQNSRSVPPARSGVREYCANMCWGPHPLFHAQSVHKGLVVLGSRAFHHKGLVTNGIALVARQDGVANDTRGLLRAQLLRLSGVKEAQTIAKAYLGSNIPSMGHVVLITLIALSVAYVPATAINHTLPARFMLSSALSWGFMRVLSHSPSVAVTLPTSHELPAASTRKPAVGAVDARKASAGNGEPIL